ncbi:hypothetical protein AZH53_07220 [Methanomicrobiaceae archaeon CYW5]|nr:hypothetical protein [Methanovulcanius yangii]
MQVAVIGAGEANGKELLDAAETGRCIGRAGAVLVCGGRGGVMEAASRGAREAGGMVVGILPGEGPGNPYLTVVIPTGLGIARNTLVVAAGDAVIAVGGGYGTLSEIAMALKRGIPVFGLGTWDIDGVIPCPSPAEAVSRARAATRYAGSPGGKD